MGMQLHESLMQNSKFHALIISCISTYRNFKKFIEIARKSQNWKATNIMTVQNFKFHDIISCIPIQE